MTRPKHSRPFPKRPAFHVAGNLWAEHPLALLFAAAVLLAWDGTGLLRMGLVCALLHETGHILAFRWLAGRWPTVIASFKGLRIPLRGVWLPPDRELWLAAAGPLVNLGLCVAAHVWMRWQGPSYKGYWFASVNLLLGAANLLPLPGLDGYRVLTALWNTFRRS